MICSFRDMLALRVLDGLTQGANICGSLLISALVVLIGVDVLGRNLFLVPVSGVPELVTLSIVAIVFLQVPQALKAGRLARADGTLEALRRRWPRFAMALDTVFDLLGAFVVTVLLFAHAPILGRSWARNEFVGAVGDFTVPTWPVKMMILIGIVLLALQFLARIRRRHAMPGTP